MADAYTIAAAARLCRCDRRTLQRAIHAGRLHLDTEHGLSREELLATGYLVIEMPQGTPQGMPQSAPHYGPRETPQLAPLVVLLERLTLAVEGVWTEMQQRREYAQQTPQGLPQWTPQYTPQDTPQEAPQPMPVDDLQAQLAGLTTRFQALQSQFDALTAHVVALAAEERPRGASDSQRAARAAVRQPGQPQALPTHYGRPGLAPETLHAIAQERARYPALTMREFAQHVFDVGIYRGRSKDGREVPADHSRLRRWLQQARQQT